MAAADRCCQHGRKAQMEHSRALLEQVLAVGETRLVGLRDQQQADLQRVETRVEQYQAAAHRREARLLKLLVPAPGAPRRPT